MKGTEAMAQTELVPAEHKPKLLMHFNKGNILLNELSEKADRTHD